MARWFEKHRDAVSALLSADERLVDADRVIAARRGPKARVPRVGFVLVVTDRRLLALKASTWLARPQEVVAEWSLDDGATLVAAGFGRLRLVLPDRTVVTLRPYGLRSVSHLARH